MTVFALIEKAFDLKALLAFAVVFILVEQLLPIRRSQAVLRGGWTTDVVYMVLNNALMNNIALLGVAAIMVIKPHIIPAALAQPIHQPVWLQVIELIMVVDFLHYWIHRAFHVSPVLWRFHALHHSVEDLDWLATFRVHPIDQLPTALAMLLPVLLLGWSPAAVILWGLIYRWQAVLQHSNLKLPLGWLSFLVVGPEYHRWHHSLAAAARDKNFAAQFAPWDLVFGTRYLPRGVASHPYGIDEAMPDTYLTQLLSPFRRPAPPAIGQGQAAPGSAFAGDLARL